MRWHIEVPDAARLLAFPPMLLQPLVENAVRHGIEPKVGGGEIGIFVRTDNATLDLRVCDNGMGLDAYSETTGTGLANVRARLATLYGDKGRLILQTNDDGGTTAVLELPR